VGDVSIVSIKVQAERFIVEVMEQQDRFIARMWIEPVEIQGMWSCPRMKTIFVEDMVTVKQPHCH